MTRAAADPTLRPIWPGTSGPSAGSPVRAVPSIRRTVSIDITFPTPGLMHLRGRGRDLRTDPVGALVLDGAEMNADVSIMDRVVEALHVEPDPRIDVASLVGRPSGGSFRKAVAAIADEAAKASVLGQLLDDIPVVSLIGGASVARRGLFPVLEPADATARRAPMIDTCAGWRADGLMIRAEADGVPAYLGEGPPAGILERGDDALSWHPLDGLSIGDMRRRRRLDIARDSRGGFVIDAMFRDSYIEADGTETAVHEYQLDVDIDPDGIVTGITTTARVLPSPECPAAVASARRVVGVALSDIRALVSSEFRGTSTCTHLNDALRSLGGMAWATAALLDV